MNHEYPSALFENLALIYADHPKDAQIIYDRLDQIRNIILGYDLTADVSFSQDEFGYFVPHIKINEPDVSSEAVLELLEGIQDNLPLSPDEPSIYNDTSKINKILNDNEFPAFLVPIAKDSPEYPGDVDVKLVNMGP